MTSLNDHHLPAEPPSGPKEKAQTRLEDLAIIKTLRTRVNRARKFPTNTDPFSRHVQMMAEALLRKGYPMLQGEPEHCAISLLATVASLFETRTELAKLKAKIAERVK